MKNDLILKLKGKACVLIDWANVYGWTKSLKKEVHPKKLFKYLKSYKQIEQIGFYFGTDKHKKSKAFIRLIKKIGYQLTTKPVKYIYKEFLRQKCTNFQFSKNVPPISRGA